MMIILSKLLLQPDKLFFLTFQKYIVQLFCGQYLLILSPLLIAFPPETVRSDINRFLVKLIQNTLCCNICRQNPDSPFSLLPAPQMTEKTVQKFMEIQPVDLNLVLHKHGKQPLRRNIKQLPICADHLCFC